VVLVCARAKLAPLLDDAPTAFGLAVKNKPLNPVPLLVSTAAIKWFVPLLFLLNHAAMVIGSEVTGAEFAVRLLLLAAVKS
jgi:hypothetical protein